ncbi:MAG: PH domain-containing protein [Clostridia bacterium]|nr:PH domain-containing protein [Clostridia bacterium]
MGIIYEDNELIIKGLFSKKKIAYKDIKSIEIKKDGIVFTTREGDEITSKDGFFDDKENLFGAIRKFNISYRNQNELEGVSETYTREELDDKFQKAKDLAYAISSQDVKKKLGEKYDIELDIKEVEEYVTMYLSLTEDGEVLKSMGAFDDITLAYLVEWDQSLNCAKYGITVEMTDEEKMREAVQYSLQYLYEEF